MKNLLLLIAILVAYQSFGQNQHTAPTFSENKGQIRNQHNEENREVLFLFQNGGMNIQLRNDGFSYDIFDLSQNKKTQGILVNRIDIDFFGKEDNTEIIAENEVNYWTNYAKPHLNSSSHVKHYERIVYKNVYPNIDFIFKRDELSGTFKYDIVLHTGSDINDIQLSFKGFKGVTLLNNELTLTTSIREVQEKIPFSFIKETNRAINIDFTLNHTGFNTAIIGFKTASQVQSTETLLIDPYPDLVWGKYIGDSLYSETKGVITDRFGYSYICGSTQSLNNIATSGAYQDSLDPSLLNDAYLMKFHKYGGLIWSTYFGGEEEDIAHDVYVDTSFNIFIAGTTFSTTGIIDSTGYQDTLAGNGDGFLAKFNANGELLWSTYFGGDNLDQALKLSTDYLENLYVAGETHSTSGIATPNSAQEFLQGDKDGFVAKFNPSGTLIWSSYIGGSGSDVANGIAYGDTAIYVVGETSSIDLTTDSTSHQASLNDSIDGFISKFNNSGQLVWQTYFGGENYDVLNSVKVLNNNVYFVGTTLSDSSIVPALTQATNYQSTKGDTLDAFVGRMNNLGSLIWASYLGGDSVDLGQDLFFELDSNLFVVGTTFSDSLFALDSSAYQTINHGMGDVFISKIERDGDFIWSTFYGGSEKEIAEAIGVYGNTSIYVVGSTQSDSSMILPQNEFYPNIFNSNKEGFFSKFNQGKSTMPLLISVNNPGQGMICDTCTATGPFVPNYICPGTEIMLTTGGGDLGTDAEWVWYEGQCGNAQAVGTGDTLIVTIYQTVTYFVRAESITNATDCISLTFLVAPYPQYNITTDSVLCTNEYLILSLSGASIPNSSGMWTGPNNYTSDSLYANVGISNDTLSGTYTVQFNDEFNCHYSDSISISFAEGPVVTSVINHNNCYGDLSGSIILFGDSLSTYNISWSNGVLDSNSIINLAQGWYNVEVISGNNCSYIDSFEVNSPPSVLLDTVLFATDCLDSTGSVILILDTLFAPYNLQINGLAITSDTASGLWYGNHLIQITSSNGCIEEHTFFIDYLNSVSINIVSAVNSTCPTAGNGQIMVEGINGNPPYTYNWQPNNQTDSVIFQLEPGTYMVTILDSSGCEASDSVTILSDYNFEVDLSYTNSSCLSPNGAINLSTEQSNLVESIVWSTGATSVLSVDSLWAGSYELVVTDTLGCVYPFFIEIENTNDLFVNFYPSQITLNAGDSVQLFPITNCQNGCQYLWIPTIDLSCMDCLNPFTSSVNDTEYTIIVTNSAGCIDSAIISVLVDSPCIDVFIPTIFSPNGDGLNDVWFIVGSCIQKISTTVYNQWGQTVFQSCDQLIGWDGTFNGALVPLDQYTYQVVVSYINGGSDVFSGVVQVTN